MKTRSEEKIAELQYEILNTLNSKADESISDLETTLTSLRMIRNTVQAETKSGGESTYAIWLISQLIDHVTDILITRLKVKLIHRES